MGTVGKKRRVCLTRAVACNVFYPSWLPLLQVMNIHVLKQAVSYILCPVQLLVIAPKMYICEFISVPF